MVRGCCRPLTSSNNLGGVNSGALVAVFRLTNFGIANVVAAQFQNLAKDNDDLGWTSHKQVSLAYKRKL